MTINEKLPVQQEAAGPNPDETRRLVIFDLDGVLVDSKEVHYEALNSALRETEAAESIEWSDHLANFDGLNTKMKLQILVERGHLNPDHVELVHQAKQKWTASLLSEQKIDRGPIEAVAAMKQAGFIVAVASNSIRRTVDNELRRMGVDESVDIILSNEDVTHPKPHPEVFWKAMTLAGCDPDNTVILEDSSIGRTAAVKSGAKLIPIDSPADLTAEFAKEILVARHSRRPNITWKPKALNILIPMAGAGSRFADAGYTFPKPLIEVMGRAMIEVVVRNLMVDGNFIFIVQEDHLEQYNLDRYLRLLAPGCQIVTVRGVTDGAARTALLASDFIDSDTPLLIANSDQFMDWDSSSALYSLGAADIDGGLVTFTSNHPKWSFAKIGSDGFISEVAEKEPISSMASTGVYYWKKGSDFVRFAKQMIEKNIRTNGEFYICPVYNEAINSGLSIKPVPANKMWGLGTPEDLTQFLADPMARSLLENLFDS